jgi:hypothetical protein
MKVVEGMSMSAGVMTERKAEGSPRLKARMAGVVYFLAGLTSVFGQQIVLGRFVVSGDAAVTAANILANQSLYWLGFTATLLAVALHIVWAVLFYDVFRPVNRSVSLVAAFFLLLGSAVYAVSSLFQFAAALILGGGRSLSAFTVAQAQDLALMCLNVNAQAFNLFIVFFGFYCALIGYLIFRSTFLPRIIGVLLAFAGGGYLTLLSPPLADALSPYNLAPAALGEPALMLWLIVVGLNARRWQERAGKQSS